VVAVTALLTTLCWPSFGAALAVAAAVLTVLPERPESKRQRHGREVGEITHKE
jgi:hypothetical protein